MTRISRRQFITTSAATGLATIILPQRAFGNEADLSSNRGVGLKASGDAHSGYQAVVLFRGRPVSRHADEGEFSAVFHNADHSIEDRIQYWRASSCKASEDRLLLEGNCELANLKATIFVQVEYLVVAPQVVKNAFGYTRQISVRTQAFSMSPFQSFRPSEHKPGSLCWRPRGRDDP
jgi:hypothetical protein